MSFNSSASRQPTRRQAGKVLIAAASSLTILRRPAAAARSVTLTGFDDWFQQGFQDVILPAFRKAHPEFPVFYNPVQTSQQALGLLRTERFFPSIDVVILDQAAAERATAEVLLQIVMPSEMPSIADLMEMAILPRSAAPVLAWNCLAIGYNKELVRNPPRIWRDLWNGAYRQLAVQRPPELAGVALTQVASVLFGGRGDVASLEVGLNALTSLAPRVSVWNPKPNIYGAVALGDAALGAGWNGPAQAKAAKMPKTYGVVMPADGTVALPLTVGLVRNAPEREGGRVLMAWLLGRDGQRAIIDALALAPSNALLAPPAASQERAGATTEQMKKWMPADWSALINGRDQLAMAWRQRNLGPL